MKDCNVSVRPFEWKDWSDLWKLRAYQLAESDIVVDLSQQGPPNFDLPYDEVNPATYDIDLERIDQAYLKARGNFWLAWLGEQPAGYVGAQDMGSYIELRHMYVRHEYRRRGIGTQLVQALMDHCEKQRASPIKLWTDPTGNGRLLYETLGFQPVQLVGDELIHARALDGEIRMQIALVV